MAYGKVYWITGLSGAGKTTLARALCKKLPGSILLDGDEVRQVLGVSSSGFDRESRMGLGFTYARLGKLLAEQGAVVVIATISLFHELHSWNRENLPFYCEIYIDVPEEIRRKRDPKGIYATRSSGNGEIVGNDIPVDIPRFPDLRLTHQISVEKAIQLIMDL